MYFTRNIICRPKLVEEIQNNYNRNTNYNILSKQLGKVLVVRFASK